MDQDLEMTPAYDTDTMSHQETSIFPGSVANLESGANQLPFDTWLHTRIRGCEDTPADLARDIGYPENPFGSPPNFEPNVEQQSYNTTVWPAMMDQSLASTSVHDAGHMANAETINATQSGSQAPTKLEAGQRPHHTPRLCTAIVKIGPSLDAVQKSLEERFPTLRNRDVATYCLHAQEEGITCPFHGLPGDFVTHVWRCHPDRSTWFLPEYISGTASHGEQCDGMIEVYLTPDGSLYPTLSDMIKKHLKDEHPELDVKPSAVVSCIWMNHDDRKCAREVQRQSLVRHIMGTHMNEIKLFICPKCSKRFVRKDVMDRHRKTTQNCRDV